VAAVQCRVGRRRDDGVSGVRGEAAAAAAAVVA